MGEGLTVYRAIQLKNEGKSIDEVADYINAHRRNFVHFFTVDDLHHLYRGGRVSKTTAIVGSLAGIKPILHVNDAGQLIPVGKVRGRKKSLLTLVSKIDELMGSYKDETDAIFIGHGDCLEDAEFVASKIREKYNHKIVINTICPTIGAHSAPGTLALFFMDEQGFNSAIPESATYFPGNLVPCCKIDNTSLRHIKYFLEFSYCFRRLLAVYSIRLNRRNCIIKLTDKIKLLLKLADFLS